MKSGLSRRHLNLCVEDFFTMNDIDVFLYKWVLGKLPVFQGIIPSWVSKPIQGGAGKNAKSSLSLSNCTTGAMVFFGHGIFYR